MNFYETLTAAVADLSEHGYDTKSRLDRWLKLIMEAAQRSLISEKKMQRELEAHLGSIFTRLVTQGKLISTDVPRFTLNRLKPKLQRELDRRIHASLDLIRTRRGTALEEIRQRFTGWATSIPDGGSLVVDRVVEKKRIRKSLAELPFIDRRIVIDQGHKLTSSINNIVATESGAIAGEWHSHWKQPNYNYREDHKERDEHIYVVRDNWAVEKGLMKGRDYMDTITMPAEEPYCRCFYKYLYTLRSLPTELLTTKGKAATDK